MFRPVVESDQALHQRVAQRIKDAIVQGELKSGDRLPTERDLAEELRVSRTVVRDALKLLSGEGLISIRHGHGIFVAEPDRRRVAEGIATLLRIQQGTIDHLFEVRQVLEAEAAAWAAVRALPEQVEQMRVILGEYRMLLESGTLGYERANELDLRLHRLIAEATGNEVLLRVMDNLHDLLVSGRQRSIRAPDRRARLLDEMGAVVDAIAAGDSRLARERMLLHLDRGWQATLAGADAAAAADPAGPGASG